MPLCNTSRPPYTFVAPVYVFAPLNVIVPEPSIAKPRAPPTSASASLIVKLPPGKFVISIPTTPPAATPLGALRNVNQLA